MPDGRAASAVCSTSERGASALVPDGEATAREQIIVVADARAVVDQAIGRPHQRVVGIQSDLDPGEARGGGPLIPHGMSPTLLE